jgi:hypothetical protein
MTDTARDQNRLPGTNEVLIAPSVVTPEEQSILVSWAEDKRRRGRLITNPRDPYTHVTPFLSADRGLTRLTRGGRRGADGQESPVWVPDVTTEVMDPLPDEFWQIRTRVIELLGLNGLQEDHYKGSFLSYIDLGGQVKIHRDARLRLDGNEYLILRCNVLFCKSEDGGHPVISGAELDIPERGMWAFYATELVHSAGEVRGSTSRARGTLSFGFLVEPSQLWQRCFRVNANAQPRVDDVDPKSKSSNELTISITRFLASKGDKFSVSEAARAIEADEALVLGELQRLQFLGVVQSLSSRLPGVAALVL